MQRRSLGVTLGCALLLGGCRSAGPYGYAQSYVPLGDEEGVTAKAVEYDPVMAQRSPEKWQGKAITLFGVVKTRAAGQGGAAYLTLSMRTLEPRNLCDSLDEDTCRVTVSEREHALLHAQVRLGAEDDLGEKSVGPASLLRVVGQLGDTVDPDDGAPVLRVSWYRHWPRATFVTTASADDMRR